MDRPRQDADQKLTAVVPDVVYAPPAPSRAELQLLAQGGYQALVMDVFAKKMQRARQNISDNLEDSRMIYTQAALHAASLEAALPSGVAEEVAAYNMRNKADLANMLERADMAAANKQIELANERTDPQPSGLWRLLG